MQISAQRCDARALQALKQLYSLFVLLMIYTEEENRTFFNYVMF